MTSPHPRPQFDEQAKLLELERLREERQTARKRREETAEQFDKFVRSFRSGAEPPRPPAEAQASLRATSTRAARTVGYAPDPPAVEPPIVAVRWKRGFGLARLALGLAIAVVAIGLAIFAARRWSSVEPDATAGTSAQTSSAVAPSEPSAQIAPAETSAKPAPAPAAIAPPAAPPPAALVAELTAVRAVWVRATVDGRRVVERELEPGERVPLRADRAIVLRAGDAGAIRLAVGGRDRGLLGRDGAIVTRVLTPER